MSAYEEPASGYEAVEEWLVMDIAAAISHHIDADPDHPLELAGVDAARLARRFAAAVMAEHDKRVAERHGFKEHVWQPTTKFKDPHRPCAVCGIYEDSHGPFEPEPAPTQYANGAPHTARERVKLEPEAHEPRRTS